jgi:hypothetical protein
MRILTKESTLQKLLHCELRDWGGGRWEVGGGRRRRRI